MQKCVYMSTPGHNNSKEQMVVVGEAVKMTAIRAALDSQDFWVNFIMSNTSLI